MERVTAENAKQGDLFSHGPASYAYHLCQDLDSFLKLTSGHSLRLLPTFKMGLHSLKEEKALNDVESDCNIFNWQ